MKNIVKRVSMLIMALVMTVSTMATVPVMAAEPEDTSASSVTENEYVVDLEPGESVDLGSMLETASTNATIDQTFTMGSYHRGADRTYSNSHLRFMITITDTNGNPTSSTLSLTFRDYNGNAISWLLDADGSTFSKNNIPIVAGRVYYFTYTNNGSQNLQVNMVIISY